MRILVVASTFPARHDDPVPAFVQDQLIAMKEVEPSLDIHVLAPHDGRSRTSTFVAHRHYTEHRFHYFWPRRAERLAGRGILPTLHANPLYYAVVPFFGAAETLALLRLVRRLRPDLVYAHWFTPQAIAARLVAAWTGTPFAYTTHAADVSVWKKVPLLGGPVVRRITRRAERVTAVSRRSMARLRQFFGDDEWAGMSSRTAIIPMGVHLPDADGLRPDEETDTLLFVGRLAEKKGVQYLLPAFARIMAELPAWRLVVAGDGPWLGHLRRQAEQLGLAQRVSFPGYVTGEAKDALIRSAGVYVVPSIVTPGGDAEGLPVSLMEGLAYGKICVASYESGADDILTHGVDGLMVTGGDVEGLAQALLDAATLPEESRRQMRVRARQTAEHLSWPRVARAYLDFVVHREEAP